MLLEAVHQGLQFEMRLTLKTPDLACIFNGPNA